MKKLFALFAIFLAAGITLVANAATTTPDQVLAFFNKYVDAANTYSETITDFYSPNAKIIRVVMKPDGTTATVTANTKQYFNQMRIGANLAKINKYKNFYTQRKITKQGADFKITCLRQPSTSDYKIPAHFVIGPDANGELKIKEEMMYTKQQKFLKYANKK